jgi:hypothetical protein
MRMDVCGSMSLFIRERKGVIVSSNTDYVVLVKKFIDPLAALGKRCLEELRIPKV